MIKSLNKYHHNLFQDLCNLIISETELPTNNLIFLWEGWISTRGRSLILHLLLILSNPYNHREYYILYHQNTNLKKNRRKLNKRVSKIKNLMQRVNLLMPKGLKLLKAKKRNKKRLINNLNRILEDSDNNLRNLKKNNLQKILKTNLLLKINFSQLPSPILQQITKLIMDNTCISEEGRTLHKDPYKWGISNSNNKSFPNKERIKSTLN